MFTSYWRFFSIAGIMSLSLPIAPAPIPTASSPESLRKSNPPHLDVNEGGVSFFPVSERNQDETRPQLGNGSVANTREWPASFIAKSGSATCTATLIGPRTLLTAAHCVGDGATATVSYLNTPIISGICRRPTSWSVVEPSNDWALCLMEKEIIRNGLAYEAISLDASAVISGLQFRAPRT